MLLGRESATLINMHLFFSMQRGWNSFLVNLKGFEFAKHKKKPPPDFSNSNTAAQA